MGLALLPGGVGSGRESQGRAEGSRSDVGLLRLRLVHERGVMRRRRRRNCGAGGGTAAQGEARCCSTGREAARCSRGRPTAGFSVLRCNDLVPNSVVLDQRDAHWLRRCFPRDRPPLVHALSASGRNGAPWFARWAAQEAAPWSRSGA
eukprot:scaffold48_cov311-Pinguiococcus_pyrenoidosus.AAC.226